MDRFWQAALTVEGKIHNFDVTYAGAYMDHPNYAVSDYTDYADAYDRLYSSVGGLGYYFYYTDAAGNHVNPQQYIVGTNHFKKMSQELRIASPADQPIRVIAGALPTSDSRISSTRTTRSIISTRLLSVNGLPGTLWLTQQKRVDRDWALFGEGELGRCAQGNSYRWWPAVTDTTTVSSASSGSAVIRPTTSPTPRTTLQEVRGPASLRASSTMARPFDRLRATAMTSTLSASSRRPSMAAHVPILAYLKTARSCPSTQQVTASPIA